MSRSIANSTSVVKDLNSQFQGWGFGGGWVTAGEGAFSLTISSPGSASTSTATYSEWGAPPHTETGTDWDGMHGTFTATLPPLTGNTVTTSVIVDIVF
jgi:hypothetical protein